MAASIHQPGSNLPAPVTEALQETLDRGNLHAYAAGAALRELHKNWDDALGDGCTLAELAGDIDATIEELRLHKEHLAERVDLGAPLGPVKVDF